MSPVRSKHVLFGAAFVLATVALSLLFRPSGLGVLPASSFAALSAVSVVALEIMLRRVDTGTLITCGLGLLAGLTLGALVDNVFGPLVPSGSALFFRAFCPLAAAFLGVSLGAAKSRSLLLSNKPNPSADTAVIRYLDSSALVDGRIVALAEAGFLDGAFIVPQFVLNELQTLADTADPLRRNRGRRGLENVTRLQKVSGSHVEISPADYADLREVDLKLIETARAPGAQIVTTDFNLAKLAQAQGIRVLNVNELATALRPIVLQGETLRVSIAKEGKEPAQGLAYLEDGTMVVVENANRQIGKTIDVLVTGVVQSVTGKMIFGRYDDGRIAGRTRNAS